MSIVNVARDLLASSILVTDEHNGLKDTHYAHNINSVVDH